MLSFRWPDRCGNSGNKGKRVGCWALMWLVMASLAGAQPALTRVQDILYRADGSRFAGTLFITWNSFQGGDTSNIATSNLILPIANGVLNVRLVPTTTASAGAQYNITYNSRGINQFTEIWAVPPSNVVLRVRDVRVSSGTVVGPAPVTSPVQISDVVNLTNELAIRPLQGVGYSLGRAAIINQSGQIDGASGNLGDCVRVDGSSGPCGSGSSGILPLFADSEVPSGVVNGSNATFTLATAPSPPASLRFYRNGLLMKLGADYSLSGSTITSFLASTPQSGDSLLASYRYANPSNPLGSLTAAQVVCSTTGTNTTSTTLTQLGTCTLPAGLLGTGDRIEVQYQFGHSGSSTGFTGEVRWGTTSVLSRSGASGETAFVGRVTLGIYAGGQLWDTQSWGNSLSLENSVGSASADTSQSVTISFRGQMAGSTSDSVLLRNFTVIRYPGQINP